jgi:gliding motility-associated-like protein
MQLFAKEQSSRLDYVKNNGQWENPVLYKADLKGGWVFLQKNELTYLFIEDVHKHAHDIHASKYIEKDGNKIPNPAYKTGVNNTIIKGHAYSVKWINSNKDVTINNEEKQDYVNNYFIGNNPSKWQENVGCYHSIQYKNIYNYIDAKLYSEDISMKTDYSIHPKGNPSDIKMEYNGVDKISLDEEGKLRITTSINTVYELKPYTYQIINNKKIEIPTYYILDGNTVSFKVEKYNKNYDLIIDPTLVFSTYSGSTSDNWGSSATHDNSGNMFLGGISLGAFFPTTLGAFQTVFGGGSGGLTTDIAITKLNSSGTSRLYSTFLGGSANELLASLLCTPNNELIAIVATGSNNYPTSTNAFDKTFNGGIAVNAVEIDFFNGADIAITKLNTSGSAIVGSTYFGGNGNDGINGSAATAFNYGDDSRSDVAIDNTGNIYITSTTSSNNIPNTSGRAQTAYSGGETDGVLAKFNADLSVLNWASYFGGSSADAAYSIGLDKANNIFICGGTESNNIPGTSNGLNTTSRGGTTDGFVAKFNNNGTSVLAATYLGTNVYDQAYILDLDKNDNVYIFGQTLGAYPVTAGVYSNPNSKQFIHKLNNNLNTTSFSTVFGRANYNRVNISPTALLVDVCGNIYAVGWGGQVNSSFQSDAGSTSQMPITADAIQRTTDGSDFYLFNLSQNGTNLIYASYLGENGGIGDHVDGGTSRFDKNGVVYQAICASCGATNSFPVTSGVIGPRNNSDNCNMAGVKFRFDLLAMQIVSTTATPSIGCSPLSVNFTYTSTRPATSFFWDFGDGNTTTTEFPNHIYNASGTYTVRFIIQNPLECNTIDSATVTVTVLDKKTNNITRNICQGQSIVFNGQTLTSAGIYRDTLRTSLGCDSFIVLNLSINPTKTTPISRSICEGESIIFNGQTLRTTGIYRDTLQTNFGCDSFIVLTLNIIPKSRVSIERIICEGQKITIGNHVYKVSGNYIDTLRSITGCDSIINLALTVNPKKSTSLQKIVCQGESVTIGNHTYNQTGNYLDTLSTSLGCDSIINLNLVVNPNNEYRLSQYICSGKNTIVGGQVFDSTGNYIIHLLTSKGCDSTIFLNLIETDTIPSFIERTICEGDSVTEGNKIFTEAGDYTILLIATEGCDSLLHLHVNVINKIRTNQIKTICEGQSVVVGTQTFNATGTYVITLKSSLNCDSIITLDLTVLPRKRTSLDTTFCAGNSIVIGNHTYTSTGNYTDTLRSSTNCDSIINLTLTVNPNPIINAIVNDSIVNDSDVVQLNVVTTEALNYNWIQGNVSNPNIQDPTAIITSAGYFVVIATNETTQCFSKDSVFVGLIPLTCDREYIYIPNAFSPNGDLINDVFYVRSRNLTSMHLEIYNRWGNKVFETDDITKGWDGLYKGKEAPTEAYAYYFTGICISGEKTILKGNVTIIR